MGFDGRLFRHWEHAPVAPDAVTGIVAVCTGPELHFARGSRSGIHRTPVPGRVAARVLGLDGDAQGDMHLHGGPEKAVHLYPQEHAAAWRVELGEHPLLRAPGGLW